MDIIKLFKNRIINIGINNYHNLISHYQPNEKISSKIRLIGIGFRIKQGIKLKIKHKNG
jgi:hypothetical protein